jgi:hypothetical protein
MHASEYPIQADGEARVDALALDPVHRPVILEFKRVASETASCRAPSTWTG